MLQAVAINLKGISRIISLRAVTLPTVPDYHDFFQSLNKAQKPNHMPCRQRTIVTCLSCCDGCCSFTTVQLILVQQLQPAHNLLQS